MSNPLRPHGLQHTRLPCPSTTPGAFKLMSIESMLPSNHLILCHPFSSCLQSFPASLFQWVSSHIRWPKYWSFSFSMDPSNECSGLISFRIDWFDLLDVQGTLKSLLQQHNFKASVLQLSAFFMVLMCLGDVRCVAACFVWIISLTLSNNPNS